LVLTFIYLIFIYRNPLLGGLCIPNTFEGGRGLTETRGFYLSGGLLNSAKKKVSVLHNDLESKVQEVGGHAAKEKNKSELTDGE